MKHPSRTTALIALVGVGCLAALGGLPLLFATVGADPSVCPPAGEIADDGTPAILGPSALSVSELAASWSATGKGQPPRLPIPIGDVIALYVTEGNAEGVRGDWAFAQAVLETGWFTNRDTQINNFAGIGHYDHASSGFAYPNALIGVRAQIQLLKKYALGNDAPMARPDVSPRAGAHATTWGGLAGTWATSTTYWESLQSVYQTITGPLPTGDNAPALGPGLASCPGGSVLAAGGYALPVEAHWYRSHPERFTKTHHDYPAADIPVPVGTPLYAITAGVVIAMPTSGACGIGVIFNGDDGAQYTYCHGLPASQTVQIGQRIQPGQLLMSSASTGNSTGPHLHLGITVNGQRRCPQPLRVAIAQGNPINPHNLPTAGCTH